jgi:hypothetical protein
MSRVAGSNNAGSNVAATGRRRKVGVTDIPLALFAPRRVFYRVEDVGAYGWPLVALLAFVTLIGYAMIQTGLIDRAVDQRVRERIATIEREQHDVVDRASLREMYAEQEKLGTFEKLMTRIWVVVAEPGRLLVSVLVIAAILYGMVALTGSKPEWNTLLTICVFAGFADALRLVMRLILMLSYGTLAVDTSLSPLARTLTTGEGWTPAAKVALAGGLAALDPFVIWFWLMVLVGLSATQQLRGWRAWLPCMLCWLVGAAGRGAMAYSAA